MSVYLVAILGNFKAGGERLVLDSSGQLPEGVESGDGCCHPQIYQRSDLAGCPCCATTLRLELESLDIDLAAQAQDFLQTGQLPPPAAAPPQLLVNARILTMDASLPEADAMLIGAGRIVWVGASDRLPEDVDPGVERIDCRGRTLLPGFVEPHMHLAPIAALRGHENIGPFRYDTVDDALKRLKELTDPTTPHTWITARQFDPSLQEGPGVLTAAMLDDVSEVQPIFVYNASLHFGYCNSKALAIAGITSETPDPPGSGFGRTANGTPNGVLKGGAAMAMVARHNSALRETNLIDACLDVFRHANEVGFTTVCDQGTGSMQGAKELALLQALRDSNQMTARYRYSLINTLAARWDETDVAFGQGDEWLRAAGWKIVSDGSNQGLTGLQREPFLNDDSTGIAYIEPQALNAAVAHRLRQGWPVVVHANGDLAIDRVLGAFEAARAEGLDPAAQRCRIEHCSILHDEQVARIAELGLSPSFLIGHVYYWGKAFRDEVFGEAKASLLDRTAACEAQGIRWTLHSDEPVTEMDPLRCIQNAVTRAMWKAPGEVLADDERISVEAALRSMTIDAAWQCHSDHEIGSLEVGKFADFVVLSADPRAVAETEIGGIDVLETWVGGNRVYTQS
jgi:predicted amidohydrolase YtcJ